MNAPVPKLEKVKLSVVPATAPNMVEYSPAKEQPDIVVSALLPGNVADPKEDAKVQPAGGAGQGGPPTNPIVVVMQEEAVPQALLVFQCKK